MTDKINHECGIALIRLRKPLEFYQRKYGTWMYGLQKLYLLMEKQHNRGQDGAGVVNLKLNSEPGTPYIFQKRSNESEPIKDVFSKINKHFTKKLNNNKSKFKNIKWVQKYLPFSGELFLGHLRYSTFGKNNIENVHPVMRQNNWKSRNLVLAGNFNLTNVDELFSELINFGQHPKDYSDTVTILENIGHFLDEENKELFRKYKEENFSNKDISPLIEKNIDIPKILINSSEKWDGGYVIAGIIGHGDTFVMRDPSGIRPAFYYDDDEILVVASERPVIQTVMNKLTSQIKEIPPASALIIKKNGKTYLKEIKKKLEKKSCSFERIYFSRGGDKDIYKERKKLGKLIVPQIIKSINNDFENTVFSFIPNTAETSFYGMMQSLEKKLKIQKKEKILNLKDDFSEKNIDKILSVNLRVEKIAIKDIKLRTFITEDSSRDDLVSHVYDTTYGVINENVDNLVIIDDSIVRGTTLKKSILKILNRLSPKKIVIVSSAPQIRYPDCYGIDMANLEDFVAFRAVIEMLKDDEKTEIINNVYIKSKKQEKFSKEKIVNYVKEIYEPYSAEEISKKIAEILKPKKFNSQLEIIFSSVENLHEAIPNHLGDWYFTGNYPTPGGNKVVNNAYINFYEGRKVRAY